MITTTSFSYHPSSHRGTQKKKKKKKTGEKMFLSHGENGETFLIVFPTSEFTHF